MNTKSMQSRRNFLGKLAAVSAATTGIALMPNPLKAADKIMYKAAGWDSPADGEEKWLNTLEGKKFPVLYDMHEHKDFWAGVWANIYLATNQTVKNVGVAIVMRHGGFPFALNDAMISKYKLGELFKFIDKNTGAPSVRNMYWEPTGKDYPLPGLDGIKALQQKGVAFCVCNMALKVFSGVVAKAQGLSGEEVYNDFVKNILPGIQLVPSGVWALGRLQQAPLSYGYINAG